MPPSMTVIPGAARAAFVAPHAIAPAAPAMPFVYYGGASSDDATLRELAERVDTWHDMGTLEALEAATAEIGGAGARPNLPRGLLDLNRPWKGRIEEKETLFGKAAVDSWVRSRLAPGAEDALEQWYRAAMVEIRAVTDSAVGLVELHSYGDLGSTYDMQAGGRPIRRSACSVIHGSPWLTAFPVGVARLIPASLRGTPWSAEAKVASELDRIGIELGPSPYPQLLPWNVSARFLAARWFRWLGESGRLPPETAARLVELAWTDEQAPAVDAAVTTGDEPADLAGVKALADDLTAWTHAGAELGDRFLAETGTFVVGIELRIDLVERAAEWGAAVARAVR